VRSAKGGAGEEMTAVDFGGETLELASGFLIGKQVEDDGERDDDSKGRKTGSRHGSSRVTETKKDSKLALIVR
jgi:hypothetical protein